MPPEFAHPTPEDRKRVEHMLKCSNDARAIVQNDESATIAKDMIRTRALVNCFTEIGEAAARLTPAGRTHVGEVPWRQIVGMRNIVVHVYWGVDVAVLVSTARQDLPRFITMLEQALNTWPSESST